MQVTVELPDEFLASLIPAGSDPARLLFEESVASAYRGRRLTGEEVRKLLGYETRMEVDAFLGLHKIYDYTLADLDSDLETLDRHVAAKR